VRALSRHTPHPNLWEEERVSHERTYQAKKGRLGSLLNQHGIGNLIEENCFRFHGNERKWAIQEERNPEGVR